MNTVSVNESTVSEENLNTGKPEEKPVNPETTINADSVENYDSSVANNAFAFDMYARLADQGNDNIFFSPYSISTAMAICYEGSRNSTQEQISDVFYFPLNKSVLKASSKEMIDEINPESDEYELNTANAIWVQESYPLNEQYVADVDYFYGGKAQQLDFMGASDNSKNTINSWVKRETNYKIKDLIPEGIITSATKVVITNAIYFKGRWLDEFDKDQTMEKEFYPIADEEILVDTMYKTEVCKYCENNDAKIIELPYKDKQLSMYVVLPLENDIENFENNFSVSEYNKLRNNMSSAEVEIWLPKFKFDSKTMLSSLLIEMGITDAFDSSKADFSELYDKEKIPGSELYISNVIHQAFVDVNEEGTEAAAATSVIMPVEGDPEYPYRVFKADHPFLFFIEDKGTGSILFMGKVERPEYE